MNSEYEERGFFKQLILALWCAFIWCEIQFVKHWIGITMFVLGYAVGTIIALKFK